MPIDSQQSNTTVNTNWGFKQVQHCAAVDACTHTHLACAAAAADVLCRRKCAGIASSVGLPLIGNGDVFSPTEWQQRLAPADGDSSEEDGGGCGVTTAMIGRAALIKPWIFTGAAEP